MNPQELRTHLRRLWWRGKLHQLLPGHQSGSPWPEVLFIVHLVFYAAAALHFWRWAPGTEQTDAAPPGGGLAWFVTLLLCGVALRVGWPLARSQEQRLKARLRASGELVPATVVQANSAYFDPANRNRYPGSLLVSFDPRAESELDKLDRAGDRVRTLKFADRSQLPRAHADIGWRLYHEIAQIPAYPVPEDLTEGLKDCWLVSASIAPDDYMAGPSNGGMMWVLALRGATSPHAVATIPRAVLEQPTPWWLVAFFWRWCVPRGVR